MNAALRLLLGSGLRGPQDRVLRIKAGGPTVSGLTFDEGTPLDSTHLLVALVATEASANPTTPSGWALVASRPGTNSFRGIYARQANGSVNGIAISVGDAYVMLLGISGFVSATPATTKNTENGSSTTSATVSISTSTAVYGIALSLVGLHNNPLAGGWGAWSGTELTSNAPGDQLTPGVSARAEYIQGAGGGSFDSTVTWAGSRNWVAVHAVFELTP